MEKRELICIGCPMGCPLTVEIDGENVLVTGNTCPRGAAYGKQEVMNPTRVVTSSVEIRGGSIPRVSVKTKEAVAKGKIFEVMEAIRKVKINVPVQIGDIVIPDCAGTGIDVIATKQVL